MPVELSPALALALWQQRQQPAWLPMRGYSMLPILRPGDQLRVTMPQATYRRGQIVVIRQGERLVVHRVVARRRVAGVWCWITQGDNSHEADAAVMAEQIEGRVSALRRGDRLYGLETPAWQLGSWLVALCTAADWRQWLRRQWLRLLAFQLRKTA